MKWWILALVGAGVYLAAKVAKPPSSPSGDVVYYYPTPDTGQTRPHQIWWSDEFLQEVWSRMHDVAAQVAAEADPIYLRDGDQIRRVGTLYPDGDYYPVNAKYPLDVPGLAAENGRAPFA